MSEGKSCEYQDEPAHSLYYGDQSDERKGAAAFSAAGATYEARHSDRNAESDAPNPESANGVTGCLDFRITLWHSRIMRLSYASALVLALIAGACSGAANESTPEPAAGAETMELHDEAASEENAPEENAPEESASEESASEESASESAENAAGESEQTVCSRFAYDLRSMPHTGPRQVDTNLITSRTRGMIHDVQVAAGEPRAQAFSSGEGSSSFSAVFIGARAIEQCERARAEVAPPIPDGVRGRRRFRFPTSTECGPCSQLVLDAIQSEQESAESPSAE